MAVIDRVSVGSTTYDLEDRESAHLGRTYGATSAAVGVDLNTLTDIGTYFASSSSGTVVNGPDGSTATGYAGGWRLFVMNANADYRIQIFTTAYSGTFIRKRNITTWTTWKEIAGKDDIAVKSISVSGATLTLGI